MANVPNIKETLMRLTKNEMMDIAFGMQLECLKSSAKKADWAAHIEEAVLNMPLLLLIQCELESWEALYGLLDQNDAVPWTKVIAKENADALMVQDMLREMGLATLENGMLHVHPWVKENLPLDEAQRAFLETCDITYDLMRGWLLYTGMMPEDAMLERVMRMYVDSDKQMPPEAFVQSTRDMCSAVFAAREGSRGLYVDETGNLWYCHPELEDPEMLLARLREPHIARLSYPEFPMEGLILDGHFDYPPGGEKLYAPIRAWMEKRGLTETETDDLLYDVALEAQMGGPSEAMNLFLESLQAESISDMNDACRLIQEVLNNMPQWANKGHSPASLLRSEQPRAFVTTPKPGGKLPPMPGRNDPCTCGSGKKYKLCCGRRAN